MVIINQPQKLLLPRRGCYQFWIRPVAAVFVLFAFAFGFCLAAETTPVYDTVVNIPGWHAQAIKAALQEFQKNQGGKNNRGEPVYGDLTHYTIRISPSPKDELPSEYEHEDCVRVDFLPELSAKDYDENVLGGRTSFGIEVAYDVCRRTMKIVKTSFSR